MPPRAALLTTDAPHHLYFAWRLAEAGALSGVLVEQRQLSPPFETAHTFEQERDVFERDVLLRGAPATFERLAETQHFESMNDEAALAALRAAKADVVFVYGTGRLKTPVLSAAGLCLNFHGGDPEEYRGLDTHLWAIYHRDFGGLVVTLHHVDLGLDTGDIVSRRRLHLSRQTRIHEVRTMTARACAELATEALSALAAGTLEATRQQRRGRYYSFMPAVLKEDCVRKFATHVSKL